MNGRKKEGNVGFLKLADKRISVGLHGVPLQAGTVCGIFEVGTDDTGAQSRLRIGAVTVKNGYGSDEFELPPELAINRIEIPFYGDKYGRCVIRESECGLNAAKPPKSSEDCPKSDIIPKAVDDNGGLQEESVILRDSAVEEAPERIPSGSKWEQLMNTYPRVHVTDEAESILIRPADLVLLSEQYQEVAGNSFLLHAYYNYRKLLLFRYDDGYYIGVAGVFCERDCKAARMFGFNAFERGKMGSNFGYYLKKVAI